MKSIVPKKLMIQKRKSMDFDTLKEPSTANESKENETAERMRIFRERVRKYGKWYISPTNFNRNFDLIK